MLLLMTVEPGFGGQHFLDLVLPKLRRARSLVAERGAEIWLQVDGGVHEETIERCAEAGADVFVAGLRGLRLRRPRPRRSGPPRPGRARHRARRLDRRGPPRLFYAERAGLTLSAPAGASPAGAACGSARLTKSLLRMSSSAHTAPISAMAAVT